MRLILLLVLFFPSVLFAKSDEIVAIVNKQSITLSDFQQTKALTVFLNRISIQNAQQDAHVNNLVLQGMINDAIIEQYAQKFRIRVADAEIENAIKNIEIRNKIPEGQLKKSLEAVHVTSKILKDKIGVEIVRSKIVHEMLGSDIEVSNGEIVSAVLDSGARDARVHLKMFTAKKNTEKSYKSMSKLSSRISGCKNVQDLRFQSFATVEDMDINLSDLSENLQARIKDLSIGEATGAVREQSGIQVALLCERKIENFSNEEAAHLSQLIANKHLTLKAQKFLQNLRKKAYVKILAH
jgi:hypothetical protein